MLISFCSLSLSTSVYKYFKNVDKKKAAYNLIEKNNFFCDYLKLKCPQNFFLIEISYVFDIFLNVVVKLLYSLIIMQIFFY